MSSGSSVTACRTRRPPRQRRLAAAVAPAAATETPIDDAGFPRRVPVPIVRPPLDWFAPTGVRLDAGSRVVVLPDTGGVAQALSAQLAERGVEVLTADVTTDDHALVAQITDWLADGPIAGLYALAALDNEPPLAELDIDQWHEGLHARVKLLAAAGRVIYDRLDEAGAFLVSATRNGGAHGYDEPGARSAMAGAVSGFTKALARERPAAVVKVLDVEADAGPTDVAAALVAETLRDAGIVEIGRRGALRLAVGLEERPAPPADPARALGPDSVFVVTGAAGSIVSAIVADLARAAGGGTFHLLDLIPAPDPGDPDLAKFVDDHDGLKIELADRIAQRGERATPVLIERELAAIERRCAAQAAIDAVTAAGGHAHWYAADLRDGAAMVDAVAAIRSDSERVDVLLHAGGLEISRFLPDKSPTEFDLVFDVKVDGWFHLLRALGDTPIGTALVFSSIAGRFGNGGQTDYSAANDLLCKSVSSFRSTRPETRGVAIDWTAWAGIGMASRGSIPKMMALAGIDMLPPAVGIPVVRREITAGGTGGEIVAAGALGAMLDTPESPLDPSAVAGAGPMVGQIATSPGDDGIVVVTELDPAAQPFLDHHRIEGTPVLPGVMGIEAFAEAARLLAPGFAITAIEDVAFLAPFKWYRDEPRRLEVHVRAVPDGDRVLAECRLDGRRMLPGQPEQVTTHFTGRVVLGPTVTGLGTMAPPRSPAGAVVPPDAIYQVYFHGPAYQVLAGAWRDGEATVGALAPDLPANHAPAGGPLAAAPRLVELCFQTAGVAELAAAGSLGLPRRVRRLEVAPDATESAARWAVVTTGQTGGVDAVVLDGEGRVLVRLSGYETIALPGAAPTDLLATARSRPALMSPPPDPTIQFDRVAVLGPVEAALRFIRTAREIGDAARAKAPRRRTASTIRGGATPWCGRPIRSSRSRTPGRTPWPARWIRPTSTRCGRDGQRRPRIRPPPPSASDIGVRFLGPDSDVLRRVRDRIAVKLSAESAGLSVVPWNGGALDGPDAAVEAATALGFPVMLKAAAGGGRAGIRRVDGPAELLAVIDQAAADAQAGFGDPTLYLEALLAGARHLEVTVVADGYGKVWTFGPNDATLRRRGDKVVIESAGAGLSAADIKSVRGAAATLVQPTGYCGVATVAFVHVRGGGPPRFLEVYPRLPPEHGLVEETTGIDLVRLQLHVGQGGHLEGEPPRPAWPCTAGPAQRRGP